MYGRKDADDTGNGKLKRQKESKRIKQEVRRINRGREEADMKKGGSWEGNEEV